MELSRAAMLAAKIDAAFPAHRISDATMALWTDALMRYPEDVSARIVDRITTRDLFGGRPPSSPALNDLLRSETTTQRRLGEGLDPESAKVEWASGLEKHRDTCRDPKCYLCRRQEAAI